jgi:hypothetical protein
MIKNATLDQRQRVLLFIAGVTLCAVFFAFGLFMGKLSGSPVVVPQQSGAQGSLMQSGTQADSANEGQFPSPAADRAGEAAAPDGRSESTSPGSNPSGGGLETVPGPTGSIGGGDLPGPLPSGSSSTGDAAERPKSFYVRAGTFGKAQEAENLAVLLRSRGFVSAFAEAEVTDTGMTRHRVLLGPWVDRDSAARTMNELRNEGVSDVTIITQP